MSTRLTSQLHRSLFALPLLAIGLFGLVPADPGPAADSGIAATIAFAEELDCDAPRRPAPGTVLAARLPGDIGLLAARVRCAP